MSKAVVSLPGQLALDLTVAAVAPPPPPVRIQEPPRPSFLEICAQQQRNAKRVAVVEAKIRAVPKARRRKWDVRDIHDQVVACRVDLLLADLPDLHVIGRWPRSPTVWEMWEVMKATDTPHGACLLKRCGRTGHCLLLADRTVTGHWEERLDAI